MMLLPVLLLPLLLGLLFLLVLLRVPLRQSGPVEWGYGLLLGPIFATLVLRLMDAVGIAFSAPAFTLVTLAALIPATLAYRRVDSQQAGSSVADQAGNDIAGWAPKLLIAALAALALLHLFLATTEASQRPLFPWDATMHWATKARVWYHHAAMQPFVDNLEWLDIVDEPGVFTDHHPAYPPTIPLMQVWICLGFGRWSETAINWPWPLLMAAGGLMFFGQARAFGVSTVTAAAFTYGLLSLPLLNTHVALAGYADFPLGLCFLGAVLALLRSEHDRDMRYLILAACLAVMATQVKNEGFFWACTLLITLLYTRLPLRFALTISLGGMLFVAGLLLVIPDNLMVAGHSLETLRLTYHAGSLSALLGSIFGMGSWHIMPPLLIGLSLPLLYLARTDKIVHALAATLTGAAVLYVFLFTGTRFAYGAFNVTASGRIGLHLVPAFLFLAMLTWQRIADRCR